MICCENVISRCFCKNPLLLNMPRVTMYNALSGGLVFTGNVRSFSEIPRFTIYKVLKVNDRDAHEDFLHFTIDIQDSSFVLRVIEVSTPRLTLMCGNVVLLDIRARQDRASSIVENAGDLILLSRLGVVGRDPGFLTSLVLHPKMPSSTLQVFVSSRPDYNWRAYRFIDDTCVRPQFLRCYTTRGNDRPGVVCTRMTLPGHRRWYHECAYLALAYPYRLPKGLEFEKTSFKNTYEYHGVPIWKLVQKQLQSTIGEYRTRWIGVSRKERRPYDPSHAMFNILRKTREGQTAHKQDIHRWIYDFYYGFEEANKDLLIMLTRTISRAKEFGMTCYFN